MLLLRALLCFLTPSRRPWYLRYADWVLKHSPDDHDHLLSLFDRTRTFSHRYDIIKLPWLKVGLHNIVNSDDAMLHTHDWSFVSVMLEGGYWEHTEEAGRCFRPPGSVLFRHFSFKHFVEVKQPSWTLLIAFTKRNVHQFMVPSFGMIRWDVLLFGRLMDPFRSTFTSEEHRYLMSQGRAERAPRP